MFRALWIKQWVQLRTLRWVGLGLGIVLPFFLWAGAAAGTRGWLGFNLGSYDLVTLFAEALPAFSVALWGLLAVMFAAQSFAGDRVDGTDRFLLERPVPRRRTWLARVLASLASSLFVVLGNTLYITALVALVQDGSGAQVYTKILTALWVGTGLAVLGTIGGMAAGEMVRTPLQAVLIGGVLAALPIGAATVFVSVFELVWIGRVHLAFIVTPILPIAMILSSYRAGCLGEPAGRGRIQRGAVVLTAALVITPALFAATAPFVLRALSGDGGWIEGVAAHADRVVVLGGGYRRQAGWMIDTAKKEKIRFLRPPVRSTAWNDDGTIVAVIHQWGVLGSVGETQLELIDLAGDTVRSLPLETERESYVRAVQWAGDLVLVQEWLRSRGARIRVIDPQRGAVGDIVFEVDGGHAWSVLRPTEDGSVYVHRLTAQDPRTFELSRLDLSAFRLEEPVLTETDDLPLYTGKALSPSGRFWARWLYDREAEDVDSHVIDLHTLERTDYPHSAFIGWLSGDRQLRAEKATNGARLVLTAGDGEEIHSRYFENGVSAQVSPDAQRFLVKQWNVERPIAPAAIHSLYAASTGRLLLYEDSGWTELNSLILPDFEGHLWISWGGPNTLVLTGGGEVTAVADAAAGAEWTPVLGRWP